MTPVRGGMSASTRYVSALDLQPGQRIVTSPGVVEAVTAPSQQVGRGTVVIHVEGRTITTNLPCPVKVTS